MRAAPDTAALLAANRRGIVAMCVAMACFIANDALVKYASESMPTAQLIFVRGVMATMVVFAVARAMGATRRIGEVVERRVLVRSLVDALATFVYLVSLFHLPIANATAINMASPLFIAMLASIFFREQVGWRRWGGIVAGFTGVVLVIQPAAEGFNVFSLVCLAGTLLHAVRDLLTRRIPPGLPSILVTLSTAVTVTILAAVLSIFEGWGAFGLFELGLLALASVFLAGGYYAIVAGMREGEASLIAPFRYTGLLWALLLGFAVWGDTPNALAWWGIALLIASGVYVLHRERVRARDTVR
ncbi:MAG: DMT family transporter [Burkholderiaceae bacterium]|nr:DMT family transporter [Burkholderiaceae bacterium]